MGRKALPASDHELRGSTSRASKSEVVKPEHLPALSEEIPAHLPDSAATAYVETVRALNSLGLGSDTDTGLVEAYALALGVMRDASEMLRVEGLTHVDDRGTLRRHPAIAIVNQQVAQIRQIAPRLGLTPLDRAGMNIRPPRAIAVAGGDPVLEEFGYLLEDE